MFMAETKPRYQNKEWLKEQYITLNRKVVDIAKECNCNRKTINWWLRKFNIPIKKQGTWNRGKIYDQIKGEKNPNWKGDNVGYYCLHTWVARNKPIPIQCEKCGEKKDYLELANISGEYKRDINDFIYLCVKCHKKYDGNYEKFIENSKNTRFKKGQKPWNKDLSAKEQPRYGKKNSPESIKKMSEKKKEYWRKKKNEDLHN